MAGDIERLINQLIEDRGITLAELTAQLGYHSKTSLVRIMKGQVSQRAADTFAKRVQSNLQLTESERKELATVTEYLRWQQDYESSREMLRFLRSEQTPGEDVWLEDIEAGSSQRFEDRYAQAEDIHITLMNSQYVPIFGQLCNLVQQRGATVEHYLHMRRESARIIHAIGELIPLMYEKGYTGYCSSSVDDGGSGGVRGLSDADAMVVQYINKDGEPREDIVVFDATDHGVVQSSSQTGRYVHILGLNRENYKPIKQVHFQSSKLNSYIQFCEDYAHLEYNRSIYKIKPDLCMAWIPADIMISALQMSSLGEMENIAALMEEFRKVHHERVRNVFEKHRVSKSIMKRSAMVRFARTGRLQDHFWGMRPFTPEERVRIFRLLLEHNENNPYFDVYFLKDNDFLRDMEFAYYENVGIMMMNASTDYAMQGNHSEVMIVHEEFMRMFKEYYEKNLLTDQVLNRAETVNFLNSLIKIATDEKE